MVKCYDDLTDEEREQADIDLYKVTVQRSVGKKIDRGVEKGIITKEDAEKLENAIRKAIRKDMYDWWSNKKGGKSFDIIKELLLELGFKEVEILEKIVKA